MSGSDFTLIGVICGVIGSALWLRAALFPGDVSKLTATYLGGNAYALKTYMIGRWEARATACWLLLGFGCSALGIVKASILPGEAHRLADRWGSLLLLGGLGVTVGLATDRLSHFFGREQFRRHMAAHSIRNFEASIEMIRRDGYQAHDPPGSVTPDNALSRVQGAKDSIREDGELLGIRRTGGESEVEYAERIIRDLCHYS